MIVHNRCLSRIIVITFVFMLSSCDRASDVVQHGSLSYNVSSVFAGDARALSLARAAGHGRVDEVKRLVQNGPSVDVVGKEEITPLWWALWAGNFEGFLALLQVGASPNVSRQAGLPVMHLAANNPDSRFLEAALRFGGNPDELDIVAKTTPLYRAVRGGLSGNTKLLLDSGANVNAVEPYSERTMPMIAITAATDFKLAYEMIQRGADVTKRTKNGDTLVDIVAFVKLTPGNEQERWREKIIEYLKEQRKTE